jgi:hypothetical protein
MVEQMQQVTLTRRLHGRMTAVRPGVLDADLSGRGIRVATRLVFSDEETFRETGTMDLGHGDAIRFRSLESGSLEPSTDCLPRHGTSVLEIAGGLGRFADASGRITSNFVLSPDGEVTDEQVVVMFIDKEEK